MCIDFETLALQNYSWVKVSFPGPGSPPLDAKNLQDTWKIAENIAK